MNCIDYSHEPDKISISDAVLDIHTTRILLSLGISARYKGYRYLRTAIILTYRTPDITDYVTKTLYPRIARICGAGMASVERTCRHAIDHVRDGEHTHMLNKYLGSGAGDHFTCAQFVSGIARYLHRIID